MNNAGNRRQKVEWPNTSVRTHAWESGSGAAFARRRPIPGACARAKGSGFADSRRGNGRRCAPDARRNRSDDPPGSESGRRRHHNRGRLEYHSRPADGRVGRRPWFLRLLLLGRLHHLANAAQVVRLKCKPHRLDQRHGPRIADDHSTPGKSLHEVPLAPRGHKPGK